MKRELDMGLLKLSSWKKLRLRGKTILECKDGIAATEFGLLLPILVVLFFGMLEASEALTVNRRVSKAVNMMSDLTSQVVSISPSEFDNLIDGVTSVMEPSDMTGVQMNIVSVILDSNDDPIVHWSRDQDGNEPYAAGVDYTDLDNPLVLDAGGSVIVAEITYPHTLSISHQILPATINFDVKSLRWPRISGTSRVQFCVTPTNCTT